MRWGGWLAAIGLITLAATQASAEEPEPSPAGPQAPRDPGHHLLVEGAVGVGAPLGWAGVSALALPVSWLGIHGGIGVGSQSLQIGAGLRGRIQAGERRYIGIGAGWSTGQIAVVGDSALPSFAYANKRIWFWDRAHLLNLDASFEAEHRLGIIRPFVGLGFVMNGGDALASSETIPLPCPNCSPGFSARVIPYLGIAGALRVF